MSEIRNTANFPDRYLQDIMQANPDNNYFTPVWNAIIDRIPHSPRVLDVGCGTGTFGLYPKRCWNAHLTGVDGSAYALEHARTAGYDEVRPVSNFDHESLPFADGDFDFCLCKDVLEHLVVPTSLLAEIARVLKPGGHLLAHVPNHFTLQGRLRFLFTNDIDTYRYFPGANRWDFPHLRFYTHSSMLQLLREAGFKVTADFSRFFPAIPLGRICAPQLSWRRALAAWKPDQFAEGFTLLARK